MNDTLLFTAYGHPDDAILNEFLDGRLGAKACGDLENHLDACPACAARLERLQAVFAELQGLSDAVLDCDLSPAILAALNPQPQIPRLLRWGVLTQLVIAAALLSFALPRTFAAWRPLLIQASKALLASSTHTWRAGEMQITTWLAAFRFEWPGGWSRSWLSAFQPETLPLNGWLIFVALILLFLVANSFLLRQVTHNGLHEGPGKE